MSKVRVEMVGDGMSRHQVIHPPNTFQNKIRAADVDVDALIARAEDAMDDLSSKFRDWLEREVARLVAEREATRAAPSDTGRLKDLYRVGHDLRGQAATLGYPLVGRLGDSLCRLMDGVPHDRIPDQLLDQHIDSIRAIVAENASGDGTPVARTLVDRLVEVTWDFVSQEAKRNHQTG